MRDVQVLFVEDDEDDYILTLDLINDITFESFKVTRAKDAQSALDLINTTTIDLCFLDYQLGAVNGIELLKRARQLGFDAPVIILTGREAYDLDETALAAGADDYLVKSELSVARLSRAMRYALARRDIAQEKVERLKAQADNQLKNQFLAHLSHELRTPLTAILGYTELLVHNNQSAALSDELNIILRNSQHLLDLLNDVLDLSKIEANKLEVFISHVNLSVVLTDVYTLMSHVAEQKGLKLKIVSDPVPQLIDTDQTRFKQVLMNLISNAIKFTDAGGITIKVSMYGEQNDKLNIDIIDTGIGIAKQHLDTIFQPFEQVADVVSKRVSGSGMGLAISYKLAKLLNGNVTAKSELHVGSVFSFNLHLGTIDYSQNTPVTIHHQSNNESIQAIPKCTGHVLVVDDVEDIRKLLGTIVKKTGAKASCAENGHQALMQIKQSVVEGKPYDLVLMDIHMPVISGDQAITLIKRSHKNIKVVAITAATMKGTKSKLMQLGFSDVISKPVNQSEIYKLLEITLAQREALAKPKFLVVEDNIDAANALKMLLKTFDIKIDIAHNKTEALMQMTAQAYDCLLTDIKLPDGSGFDVIAAIKCESPQCYIAVVSGEDLPSDEARDRGVNITLQKPIKLASLKSLVDAVID